MRIRDYFSYAAEPFKDKLWTTIALQRNRQKSSDLFINWDWATTPYNRVALVNRLLSKFTDPRYLEIGCATDVLFRSVWATEKVGVDPEQGGTIRVTSDEYFAKNTERFNVVFVDGLHEYEQVHRDAQNSLSRILGEGYVAFHDMLPGDWISSSNPRLIGGTWNGDVWKLAFELNETPGLEFKIVAIDQGVGVIKVTDSKVVIKDFSAKLVSKDFKYFYNHISELPIISWDEFTAWIKN